MLADSGLLQDLEAYVFSPAGLPMCIYGYSAYPLRVHLLPEPSSHSFNGSIQCSHELCKDFSGVALWRCYKLFQDLDCKKNFKIGMSSIGKMCIVCALLHNAHTCLSRNTLLRGREK